MDSLPELRKSERRKGFRYGIPSIDSRIPLIIHEEALKFPMIDDTELSPTIREFNKQVQDILTRGANEKNYNGRELYDFTNKFNNDHALGEIVYKVNRYRAKQDKKDLIKIAAWAALIYDKAIRNENKLQSAPKDSDEK